MAALPEHVRGRVGSHCVWRRYSARPISSGQNAEVGGAIKPTTSTGLAITGWDWRISIPMHRRLNSSVFSIGGKSIVDFREWQCGHASPHKPDFSLVSSLTGRCLCKRSVRVRCWSFLEPAFTIPRKRRLVQRKVPYGANWQIDLPRWRFTQLVSRTQVVVK